jgi:hypothetical protein
MDKKTVKKWEEPKIIGLNTFSQSLGACVGGATVVSDECVNGSVTGPLGSEHHCHTGGVAFSGM